MQSKIIEKEVEKKVEYSCLMKSKSYGQIVLFAAPGQGMVVVGSEAYTVGAYSVNWDTNCYDLFHGTIELSN